MVSPTDDDVSDGEDATPEQAVSIDPKEIAADETIGERDPITGVPRTLTSFSVSEDPSVSIVPDFLGEAEIAHLLSLAEDGWAPSEVGSGTYKSKEEGKDLTNGVSKIRTSYSCQLEPCQTDMVKNVENRLAALAGMGVEYLEPLNMVRYAPGQFFKLHHDGRFRPKTVFLYLNDLPADDGGETLFPKLGIKIVPKRGCAVIWSNILGPQQEDRRLVHQGLPPKSGIKYGVNCFFNDKPMRRYVCAGNPVPTPNSGGYAVPDVQVTVDPVQLALDNPPAQALAAGCLRRLRISQSPPVWVVPDVLSSTEVSLLIHSMDKQQGRASAADAPGSEDEIQQMYADLQPRLAVAAGLDREASPVGLELRRRTAEISGGSSVLSEASLQALSGQSLGRAVYLCLSDLPDGGGGELLFPSLGFKVRSRSGCAIVWNCAAADEGDGSVTQHMGLPPTAGARYGASCVFAIAKQ
eukprot:TRINITY_DN59962_c0_g1_i1.p1 TRINITY_DN59962_c0_g1~~TRINITY_DN59962_c0_g1_i1.p1  ORF type:complete len:466 (-),score=84.70 TRINITY_DN59962_c0_g1_i1:241-1638(-)